MRKIQKQLLKCNIFKFVEFILNRFQVWNITALFYLNLAFYTDYKISEKGLNGFRVGENRFSKSLKLFFIV